MRQDTWPHFRLLVVFVLAAAGLAGAGLAGHSQLIWSDKASAAERGLLS